MDCAASLGTSLTADKRIKSPENTKTWLSTFIVLARPVFNYIKWYQFSAWGSSPGPYRGDISLGWREIVVLSWLELWRVRRECFVSAGVSGEGCDPWDCKSTRPQQNKDQTLPNTVVTFHLKWTSKLSPADTELSIVLITHCLAPAWSQPPLPIKIIIQIFLTDKEEVPAVWTLH